VETNIRKMKKLIFIFIILVGITSMVNAQVQVSDSLYKARVKHLKAECADIHDLRMSGRYIQFTGVVLMSTSFLVDNEMGRKMFLTSGLISVVLGECIVMDGRNRFRSLKLEMDTYGPQISYKF
jgi:hypothetical protein